MNYLTDDQKSRIVAYKAAGYSSRQIAQEVLGSKTRKSTVNDFLTSNTMAAFSAPKKENQPKILMYDLETSASITATFGRHNLFLSQDNVIREGGKILCFGYRWLGEPTSKIISMTSEEAIADNDSRVVAELWELFEQADAVVAHNAVSFDVPMLKARVIANNLPPLPTVKVIDTLKMAKQFRFPNNKLDSLAAFFGLERKVDAGGIQTWIDFSNGQKEAIKHMIDYCLHDTNLLHDIFIKLRSFGYASDFNAAFYTQNNATHTCNVCGSADLVETGRHIHTAVSKFEEMRCGSCGAVSRTRKPINTKEERSKVVVSPKQTG